MRDSVRSAVDHRSVVHPASENGADCAPDLFHRIGWEVFSSASFDQLFELRDQFLQLSDRQLRIFLNSGLFTLVFKSDFEWITFCFIFWLQLENDVAVHLDESTIAIPCRSFITGLLRECNNGVVVQADIENGVHHAGHRFTST